MNTSHLLTWHPFKSGWYADSERSGTQYSIQEDGAGGWLLSIWHESHDDPEPLLDFPHPDVAKTWAESCESEWLASSSTARAED